MPRDHTPRKRQRWALDPESMTPELWAKSQIASNYYISHAKKKKTQRAMDG